jgi:hypothetical protein
MGPIRVLIHRGPCASHQQVPCSPSRVVPRAHRVVGPGTHRGSGPREVHTTTTVLHVDCPIGRPMQYHIRLLMTWRRESEERERPIHCLMHLHVILGRLNRQPIQ